MWRVVDIADENRVLMGRVSMMFITDKQYAMVRNYEGNAPTETEKKPDQLALF